MEQNRMKAFVRTLVVLALALFGTGSLAAQTGKIDGRVRNDQGGAIGGAAVTVVGTAFTTVSNKEGYFFINNVPSGRYDVRLTAVGYAPVTIRGLQVLTDQTAHANDVVMQSAQQVTLGEITVTAAPPLIPKDLVTSRQVVDKDFAALLPEQRISSLLSLTPGITRPLTGDTSQISVRGSRYSENSLYIDGVPVQQFAYVNNGTNLDNLATNSFEDLTITTGAADARFGNALGGVINVTTRTGGQSFQGSLRWDTGMLGGAYATGRNTFQLNVSGPTPLRGLTFNVSSSLEGTAWGNTGYYGWLFPGYSTVGIDTTFMVPRSNVAAGSVVFNNSRADSIPLNVYQTAVLSGDCDNFWFVKDASLAEMRDNYGVKCSMSRTFSSPSTRYTLNSRLDYSYGRGGRLMASYNWTGNQSRPRLLTDGRQTGTIGNSTVATFSISQPIITGANRNISFKADLSLQGDNSTTSPITVESEKQSRTPFSGFLLHKLDLIYDRNNFTVDSTFIKAFLTNSTANYRNSLIPALNANTGGVSAPTVSAGFPGDGVPYRNYYSNMGSNDVTLSWNKETRRVLNLTLDAQVDRYNRFQVGATHTKVDSRAYSAGSWYRPVTASAFINDNIDLSDIVLNVGLRWDYFNYNLMRWNNFPRISTLPDFDPANPDRVMKKDKSHSYLAPRVQVAFPVTQTTNFRLSYAQQSRAPTLTNVATNHSADIERSGVNSRSTFGDDVDFAKTVQFEFGVAHAFSDDMTMDIAFYNKDNLANASTKFGYRIDPKNGQLTQLYLLQNSDFGNSRGIEFSLNRQIGQYLNGRLNYSYSDTKNTSSDINSFLSYFEALVNVGDEPPLQMLPTASSRPHTLNGVLNVAFPRDFKRGTLFGKIAGGLSMSATFQLQSGTAYTRCDPLLEANQSLLSTSRCSSAEAVQNYLGSRLPMNKMLNTQFRRTFQLGKHSVAAYLNINNILNLTNINQVYATTGTTNINPAGFAAQWTTDSNAFVSAAVNHQFWSGGAMVLPKTTAACGKVGNASTSLAQSCFYWIRSEQRFGNGDGIYTVDEWRRVSDLTRAKSRHISSFTTGSRTMAFGLTVNF